MNFNATPIDGLYVIDPKVISDHRGWFTRTFCKEEFKSIGFDQEWVQMNHSFTNNKGALRGMHFQVSPYREIKLIRCIAGAVWDVAIDLRQDSKTFLKWFGIELNAENKKMVYLPQGFAHGFQALKENSELVYHHSEYYKPGFEGGIRFDDPVINIGWPLPISDISDRDLSYHPLSGNFKGI